MRLRAARNVGFVWCLVAFAIGWGGAKCASAGCPGTDRTGPWLVEDHQGRDFLLVPCLEPPEPLFLEHAVLTIYFDGRPRSRGLEFEVYPVASFSEGSLTSREVPWLHPEADFDTTFQCRQMLPMEAEQLDVDVTSIVLHMAETGHWTGLAVGTPLAKRLGLSAWHLSVLGPCPQAKIVVSGQGAGLAPVEVFDPRPAESGLKHGDETNSTTNADQPTLHEPNQPAAAAGPPHEEAASPPPPAPLDSSGGDPLGGR